MRKEEKYPEIDLSKTGMLLKFRVKQAGYTVKDIQEYLKLSCPQPIYRWFNGKIMPSINHLYALGKLLNVHMEDLIFKKLEQSEYSIRLQMYCCMMKRKIQH